MSEEQTGMSNAQLMEWVFKVTTALVIPTIVWTLKLSNDIAVLKDRSSKQSASSSESLLNATVTKAAVNEATIQGVKEKVDRISDTLDRIETYLITRSP
jgi:hypothetical protein